MGLSLFLKKNVYWIAVKSVQLEWRNLLVGLIAYFSTLFFSVALIFSEAFTYLGIALFVLFCIYCIFVLFCIPVAFGAIISQYFFRAKEILNIYYILFGIFFIVVTLILPILGGLFFTLLYFYTFGLMSRLFWYSV